MVKKGFAQKTIIRLCAVAFALSTPIQAFAQSLKVENPAPLKPGINRAVIDSFGTDQFWTFTANPGHFQLSFSRSGAQEGFNVAKCGVGAVFAPKTPGCKLTYVESAGGTVFTGDVTQPTRVIIMVEPAKSPLVRQTNEYTLEASGSAGFSTATANTSPAAVVGVYSVGMNDWGAAKFSPDGRIVTTSGANGTWQVFDADTRTYIVIINGQKMTLTFQPGRGFVDNNGILTFQAKASVN